ncbi:MAG: hypothetical protein RLN76_04885 [Phycisphaeraceae bacterium]
MDTLRNFLPVVAILFILMALFSFAARKRQAPRTPARDQLEDLKQRKSFRDDLGNLMVEVEELTRRFSSQIDAKTVRLERLIQEAEIRIDQLNQLEARHGQKPSPTPSTSDSAGTPDSASPMQTLTRSVHTLADQGHDPAEIAEKLGEHIGKVELILALRTSG